MCRISKESEEVRGNHLMIWHGMTHLEISSLVSVECLFQVFKVALMFFWLFLCFYSVCCSVKIACVILIIMNLNRLSLISVNYLTHLSSDCLSLEYSLFFDGFTHVDRFQSDYAYCQWDTNSSSWAKHSEWCCRPCFVLVHSPLIITCLLITCLVIMCLIIMHLVITRISL